MCFVRVPIEPEDLRSAASPHSPKRYRGVDGPSWWRNGGRRAGQRLGFQASMAGKRAESYEVRRRAFDGQGIPRYETYEWHGEAENGDGAARTGCTRDLKE